MIPPHKFWFVEQLLCILFSILYYTHIRKVKQPIHAFTEWVAHDWFIFSGDKKKNPRIYAGFHAYGGGDGNWTHVRKPIPVNFYECSFSFQFPALHAEKQAYRVGSSKDLQRIWADPLNVHCWSTPVPGPQSFPGRRMGPLGSHQKSIVISV